MKPLCKRKKEKSLFVQILLLSTVEMHNACFIFEPTVGPFIILPSTRQNTYQLFNLLTGKENKLHYCFTILQYPF